MKRLLGLLVLAAACAGSGSSSRLGLVSVRDYDSADPQPWDFAVYPGRLAGQVLDVSMQGDCVRGVLRHTPVALCRQSGDPGGPERWAGNSGELELRPSPDGTELQVDGWFGTRGTLSRQPVRTTLPFGSGPQAEELRRNPVLLAIAGASLGVFGQPPGPGER